MTLLGNTAFLYDSKSGLSGYDILFWVMLVTFCDILNIFVTICTSFVCSQVEKALQFFDSQCVADVKDEEASLLIQEFYIKELLDWVLTKGLSKKGLHGSDAFVLSRVWQLLSCVLETPTRSYSIPSSVAASLISTTGIILDALKKGDEHVDDLVKWVVACMRALCRPDVSFVLHFEHAVQLLESSLKLYMYDTTEKNKSCISEEVVVVVTHLYLCHKARYSQEKKVWDAIVSKLLFEVSYGAFKLSESNEDIRNNCESILLHAMFSQGTMIELAQSIVGQHDDNVNMGSYTKKLLPGLKKIIDDGIKGSIEVNVQDYWHVVQSLVPWIVCSFSSELQHTLMTGKDTGTSSMSSADSMLFYIMSGVLVDAYKSASSAEQHAVLSILSRLVSHVKSAGFYRPTGEDGKVQQGLLQDIVKFFFDEGLGSEDGVVVVLCIQGLASLVKVEHRGIEDRLEDYWSMIDKSYSCEAHYSETCTTEAIQVFINEFGDLRRLDVFFASLSHALQHSPVFMSTVLEGSEVINCFERAFKSIPSGQVVRFIELADGLISSHFPQDDGWVGAASVVCILLQSIPVDQNNVLKVTQAARNSILRIQERVSEVLDDLKVDLFSSLLTVMVKLLDIQRVCSNIDPNIPTLHGQSLRPPFEGIDSNYKHHDSITVYASENAEGGKVSIPLKDLVVRAHGLTGSTRARLLYSLFLLTRYHLEILSEQYEYMQHTLSTNSGMDDQDKIACVLTSLLEIVYDILQQSGCTAVDGKSHAKEAKSFGQITVENIPITLMQMIDTRELWFNCALSSLEKEEKLQVVKLIIPAVILAKGPCIEFVALQVDSIIDICRCMLMDVNKYVLVLYFVMESGHQY